MAGHIAHREYLPRAVAAASMFSSERTKTADFNLLCGRVPIGSDVVTLRRSGRLRSHFESSAELCI